MHQIQEEIGIPRLQTKSLGDNHTIFVLGPLPPGYGVTLGNAMRRVLLSTLPGSSVTGMKIEGVSHEYSTIPGIKESVLDIGLNIRKVNFKKTTKDISTVTLSANKEGVVTAKDIKCTSDIEVMNPDAYITTLDKGAKLDMSIRVEKGVGFIPATVRQKTEDETGMIVLDAAFSPVRKIRYEVEATRVGQMTNLDKVTLEIKTNGSIDPEKALKFASNILSSYFNLFNEENIMVEPEFMSDVKTIIKKQKEEENNKPIQESYTPIEILGFSPRTLNALINGGIGSVEQLSKCTESKLTNLRGFGKKALTEVSDALAKKDLSLSAE